MGSGMEGGRIDARLCLLVFAIGWGIAEVAGDTAAESVGEFAADSGTVASCLLE